MNALHSSPWVPWLLSYLFNALWQIPLVFLAARIVVRLLRHTGPHVEHRVWVTALLLQVALPACDPRIAALWHALLNLLPSNEAGSGTVGVLFGPATTANGALRIPFPLEAGIVLAWVACLLYFAGRLVWGLHRTRALARTATRITLAGEAALLWSRHCRRLGMDPRSIEIGVSSEGIGPVTIGFRRSLLLLPPAFLEIVAPVDLDAVLAHELAHIQRRDFARNLLYALVSLPVAWHPVVRHLRGRIAESRELICDAVAAEFVAGPRPYAQSLLRLASTLSTHPRVATFHALGILNFNQDANTLERRVMVLTRKPTFVSTGRRVLIAAACSVLTLATCTTALALHTDAAAFASIADSKAPKMTHVEASVMSGQKIAGDFPVYPPEARAKKIQGTVVLNAVIGKDGAIESLHVVKSPDKLLSESALKAVQTWRYHPYFHNGDPVAVDTTVNVTYNLEP